MALETDLSASDGAGITDTPGAIRGDGARPFFALSFSLLPLELLLLLRVVRERGAGSKQGRTCGDEGDFLQEIHKGVIV
jgi:hypothetical protein